MAKLHLPALVQTLDGAGIRHSDIILEAGEETKDFAHLERVTDELPGGGASNLWRVQISADGRRLIGEPQRLTSGTGERDP